MSADKHSAKSWALCGCTGHSYAQNRPAPRLSQRLLSAAGGRSVPPASQRSKPAQRGASFCPGSHSKLVAEMGCRLGPERPQSPLIHVQKVPRGCLRRRGPWGARGGTSFMSLVSPAPCKAQETRKAPFSTPRHQDPWSCHSPIPPRP